MALDALIDRRPPSKWRLLLEASALTLASMIVTKRSELAASHSGMESRPDKIRVVCISDTHNTTPVLPPGNLLVHAGDLTQNGTLEEVQRQLDWLDQQPYEHKVVIAGNQDLCLDPLRATQNDRSTLSWGSITYLEDSSARLRFRGGRTLCIHGNPWTRKHGNWAFQYAPSVDQFSGQLEDDVDILITHSPPKHHLDLGGLGDSFLLQELWRIRPKLHVFGHTPQMAGPSFAMTALTISMRTSVPALVYSG